MFLLNIMGLTLHKTWQKTKGECVSGASDYRRSGVAGKLARLN